MEFTKVTKLEFVEFRDSYPKPLIWDCTGICDPPLGSYNDFSDGKKWPDSMVCKVYMNSCRQGEQDQYFIKTEIK